MTTCLTYLLLFSNLETLLFLAGREAVLEGIGALLFFLSSAISLTIFIRLRRERAGVSKLRIMSFLLLAVFFFVAWGEEASWGRRVLRFEVPEELAKLNVQREVTIHNIPLFDEYDSSGQRKKGARVLLTANRLFDYFMITSFILIPWIYRRFPRVRDQLANKDIPVLPLVLGFPLLLNILLTLAFEVLFVTDSKYHGAVSEIREFNYSFLCFVAVLYLLFESRKGRSHGLPLRQQKHTGGA